MSESPKDEEGQRIKSVGAEKKPEIVEVKEEDQHRAQQAEFIFEEAEKRPGLTRSGAICRRAKTGKQWR